jgi:hypothetical protein
MGEELLVYCSTAQKAFLLSPPAARLFELCDGTRSRGQLARLSPSQSTFEQSLAELEEHGLLEGLSEVPRRRFLQAALVMAVAAPSPALAASVVAGPGGCITNIQCGSLAWTNSCRPCDPSNNSPADCSVPNSFCMRTFRVTLDINGDPLPGGTCLTDTHALGFPDQCDFVNPSNIWALNCNDARAAVIAQGKPFSNYRCCNCS